jgi:hypothetical protein
MEEALLFWQSMFLSEEEDFLLKQHPEKTSFPSFSAFYTVRSVSSRPLELQFLILREDLFYLAPFYHRSFSPGATSPYGPR